MTYLDVVFNYGALPGENELRAIDSMREVYGIRRVNFNEKEKNRARGVRCLAVEAGRGGKVVAEAGIDVREQVALA